jgi:hypothetical protein
MEPEDSQQCLQELENKFYRSIINTRHIHYIVSTVMIYDAATTTTENFTLSQ